MMEKKFNKSKLKTQQMINDKKVKVKMIINKKTKLLIMNNKQKNICFTKK